MSFFGGIIDWLKGDTLGANLAKTAGLFLVSRLINSSTSDDEEEYISDTTAEQEVDKGVRLQLKPNTQSKIPVLYGDAYFGGYLTDADLTADYKTMYYCFGHFLFYSFIFKR